MSPFWHQKGSVKKLPGAGESSWIFNLHPKQLKDDQLWHQWAVGHQPMSPKWGSLGDRHLHQAINRTQRHGSQLRWPNEASKRYILASVGRWNRLSILLWILGLDCRDSLLWNSRSKPKNLYQFLKVGNSYLCSCSFCMSIFLRSLPYSQLQTCKSYSQKGNLKLQTPLDIRASM